MMLLPIVAHAVKNVAAVDGADGAPLLFLPSTITSRQASGRSGRSLSCPSSSSSSSPPLSSVNACMPSKASALEVAVATNFGHVRQG